MGNYIIDVDKHFIIIKYLIEAANKEARGCCFYKESVDELMEGLDELRSTLTICQVPNKK